MDADEYVSIHAPLGGATRSLARWQWQFPGFNPRAPRGRDMRDRTTFPSQEGFQSTRP